MARPIRVEFPGAVYHVMARGNERREVFRDDRDRECFLDTLAEVVERYGWRLHAYCLMGNHYHALIGTPRGNLSRGMGWLQATYTARFNARHRRRGHLFSGRYKAQLVDADEYARWLVEYLHLNPVRPLNKRQHLDPSREQELKRYRWSSHQDYAGLRRRSPAWLCLEWQRYWGSTAREAITEYRKAIRQAFGRVVSSPWEQVRRGLILGGDVLYDAVKHRIEQRVGLQEARWTVTEEQQRVTQRVKALAANATDQRIQIWARVCLGAEPSVAVARQYGYRDGSAVRHIIKRLETTAKTDRTIRSHLDQLRKLSRIKP
jgi:REP element-mobilizing transposase RayT